MTINDFLTWLLASGGSISATSWILERIGKFQQLASDVKEWIFFGLSTLISIGAYCVVTFVPKDAIEAITPYFLIISGTFITVILGKIYHKADKK